LKYCGIAALPKHQVHQEACKHPLFTQQLTGKSVTQQRVLGSVQTKWASQPLFAV